MPLPEYAHPPVVETVIGMEFTSLPGFGFMALAGTHALWASEFPVLSEQDALPPTRPASQGPSFAVQFGNGRPAGRLWMSTVDQHLLIQIQHDRLLLNWRKLDDGAEYPRFDSLFERFSTLLSALADRVRPTHGELAPLVTEWSYVNMIDSTSLSGSPTFAVWSDPDLRVSSEAILTRFQHVRSFTVDGVAGQVELSAEPVGFGADAPVNLTISAKCFHSPDTDLSTALESAKIARVVARGAFDAVTTDAAKKVWGESQ